MFDWLLKFKIPHVLQWKLRAEVRSGVRGWHIAFMTAEPNSPIFHLPGGGKPWPRGLVPPGKDVQTLSEKAHSGNCYPLYHKYAQREVSLNSLPHPSHGDAFFDIWQPNGAFSGGKSPLTHQTARGTQERQKGWRGGKKGESHSLWPLLLSVLIITAHPLSTTFSFCSNN